MSTKRLVCLGPPSTGVSQERGQGSRARAGSPGWLRRAANRATAEKAPPQDSGGNGGRLKAAGSIAAEGRGNSGPFQGHSRGRREEKEFRRGAAHRNGTKDRLGRWLGSSRWAASARPERAIVGGSIAGLRPGFRSPGIRQALAAAPQAGIPEFVEADFTAVGVAAAEFGVWMCAQVSLISWRLIALRQRFDCGVGQVRSRRLALPSRAGG